MTGIDARRWQAASRWLERALELPVSERAAWLAALELEQPEVAQDLRSLLEAAEQPGYDDFLADAPALAGQRFGAYVLERELGEGGMGSVWLGRRDDGRFAGHVAIKLPNLSRLTRAGSARFEREGALLGRLSHPHIARLLDAGVQQGQPYLVLEYVDGQPIDAWCDARRLGVRERLGLFLDVLDAVAHAHANLVLHRDLKPSNILVDADGRAKLLDFGVAKLLEDDARPAAATELTREAGRAFTPAYAAPEQHVGGSVTTATDVYSLGVLLYVLLSARHPTLADGADGAGGAGGSAAPLDAASLSTAAARTSPEAAAARATTRPRLVRALRGDLENVVGTALKVDPAERYPTVQAFADDLRRYLRDEPVVARRDSVGYRAAKFVRRHRYAVGAAAAISLALVAGAAGTAWQAVTAARERDRALALSERARAASEFVEQMIYGTWGAEEGISRDEFLTRSEALALRLQAGNTESTSVVLNALGSYRSSLGDNAAAERLLKRAVAALPADGDRSWRAQVECNLAANVGQLGRADEARAALERWTAADGVDPAVAVQCEMYLAQLAQTRGDAEAALRHAEQAQRRIAGVRRVPPLLLASLHGELGYGLALNDRIDEADEQYALAVRLYREHGSGESPSVMAILNNWAVASWRAGDVARALEALDEVVAIGGRRGPGGEPPIYVLSNRATALLALGRFREAEERALQGQALAARISAPLIWRQRLLVTRLNAVIEQRRFDDALPLVDELRLLMAQGQAGLDPHVLPLAASRLAQLRGDAVGALAALESVLDAYPGLPDPASPAKGDATLALALRRRAELALAADDADAALRDAEAAVAIGRRQQAGRQYSVRTGRALVVMARARAALGRREEASAAATEAVRHLEAMHVEAADADLAEARRLAS